MAMMEYECPTCSYSFDQYQAKGEGEPKATCPHCGSKEAGARGPAQKRVADDGLQYFQKNRCSLSFG